MNTDNKEEPFDVSNYDISGLEPKEKTDLISAIMKPMSEMCFKLYYSAKLENGMEQLVINETTGEHFLLSFRKVDKETLKYSGTKMIQPIQ